MSYILEALRKSERQRREVAEEPLARLTAAPPSKRSHWRKAIVLLSALTNVVVLAYLFAPMLLPKHLAVSSSVSLPAAPDNSPAAPQGEGVRADQPAVAVEAPAASKPEPAATPRESIRPAKAKPAPPSSGVKVATPSRVGKQPPRQRPAILMAEEESGTGDLPADALARIDTARLPASVPDAPERTRHAAAVGGDLPQPKINVYAYTARVDGDRFVIIRNRKYREGDRIDDGPVVRRIEEHGMTLEFAGQTYKIPRP